MDAYLALVRELPLPTVEQRRNFVEYVATAHSWYKHLPASLPGAPFYFFVDRAAGCDWLALRDGSNAIAERTGQGFHYSSIPTAEYRTRFGFLSYSCESGTAVFLSGEPLTLPRDKVVAIPGEDARPCYLPQAILDAGRAELTAVIHPHFSDSAWCLRADNWPTESGGQMTLQRMFERVVEMRTPKCKKEKAKRVENWLRHQEASRRYAFDGPVVDPVLRELVGPERLRQTTEMLKAIDRVCMLIHGVQQSPPDLSG